jgi:hypothetical protein
VLQLYQPLAPAGSTQKAKKEDECIPDKLVMSLCLSLCLNTIVLGLHQAYVRGALTGGTGKWVLLTEEGGLRLGFLGLGCWACTRPTCAVP